MGQKVNPRIFRVGPALNRESDFIWYAEKDYADKLSEGLKIKNLVKKRYEAAQISNVTLHRPSNSLVVNIHAKKPGIVIGKGGADIEKLKKNLHELVKCEVFINVHEVKKPALDSEITVRNIADQLEKRVSFRKAMKNAIQNALKQGARGIKVSCSGRLGGAEIARTEWYSEGRVPLQTLRADIDYSTAEANTTYGVIGVKVWINRGDYSSSQGRNPQNKNLQGRSTG